jgi:fructose-1,6-bisphosphatase/sedoheptulose 1,7-bisphosphatase-like protein
MYDPERTVEFEFVRATENAALNAMRFIGMGDKNAADAAACDAIQGVFDLVDIRGEVVIGEGIKDKAPGIFLGTTLENGDLNLLVSTSPSTQWTVPPIFPRDPPTPFP